MMHYQAARNGSAEPMKPWSQLVSENPLNQYAQDHAALERTLLSRIAALSGT
jgi:hypothetical protein